MTEVSKVVEVRELEHAPVIKKTKPVVHYIEQLAPVVVGQRAQVTAYQHYRLGRVSAVGEFLNTSLVVAVGEDGTTFETLNTMYVQREQFADDEPAFDGSESEAV